MAISRGARVVAGMLAICAAGAVQGQISYSGGTYAQNFDGLPALGTFTLIGPGPHALSSAPISATGLAGWSFSLVPGSTSPDAKFAVGTGASATGSMYSYGTTGQLERALGSLASGSVVSRFGAVFRNDTPNTITRVTTAYAGEQWRYGGSTTPNTLRFSYAIGAMDIANGAFTDVSALSFVSPILSGSTGARDGNAPANRVGVASTVSGLAWVPGQTLVFRWTDENESGNDNGVAIDDFTLTTDSGTGPLEIISTFPGDGAIGGFPNSSITIFFNHPAAVTGAWYQVIGSVTGPHAATVSGPPTNQTIRPTNEFAFGEMVSVKIFAAGIVDQNTGLNLPADHTITFATIGAPASVTRIHDIQGRGESSPLVGNFVTIQGVVTGAFQSGTAGLSGFFVQEEEEHYDTDAETSEGIFVFDDGAGVAVNVGDRVSVTGIVAEVDGQTELAPVASVRVDGLAQLPAAIAILLPVPNLTALEKYEGMRVTFPQTLTVTDNYALGSSGEVELSFGGQLPQPTNVVSPGAAANALQALNNLNRILLDDGNSRTYPDPTPYLPAGATRRIGDTTGGINGVLAQFGGSYRIEPTSPVTFSSSNPRPLPPSAAGRVRVVGANVLNYFNGDGQGGGFPTSRGASSAAEFSRQREKVLAGLSTLRADVYGLTEIENDGYNATSAIRDLVNGLNAVSPGGTTYRYVFPGFGLGGDEIKCALIYREETIELVGAAATTTTSPFNANRPPFTQTFREIVSGEKFTVAVNHFRSKGGSGTGIDADQGDGQGVFNHLRTLQARVLVDWLATDPTGSADADVLIIGDLNSYAREDPVTAIRQAGYVNLTELFEFGGGYSYVFGGQSGHLDHALATPSLASQVVNAFTWHINADEPEFLDYNVEHKSAAQQAMNVGSPFRASDHDPIVVDLNLAPAQGAAILEPPAPLTVNVGETAVFHVLATGTPALAYQWRKGLVDLPGQTQSTLTLINAQLADAGVYAVVVTNFAGSALSVDAALRVNLTYAAWSASIAWPAGADTSPGGDADGDGLANAVEYVLNTDPLSATASERPMVTTFGAAFEFTYRRRINAGAVDVDVQTSVNLRSWTSLGPGARSGSVDAATDQYSLNVPMTGGAGDKIFFRLGVTIP